ncbi:MAG: hypothetical protein JXK05_09715 [Campylobacterales bacterium]|nr:hypothetical protein [Campylobacterales bacterium]
MKRYLEPDQIQARFFLLYFLYGRTRYGSKGNDAQRIGALSAYRAMMNLYKPMALRRERVLIAETRSLTLALCDKARRELPEGALLDAFLDTIETINVYVADTPRSLSSRVKE